jgi:hypothetical protein
VIEQLPERYRKRIEVDSVSGCWLWRGWRGGKKHYAYLGFCGHQVVAHRFLFELLVGPVPDGLDLHHECEVPHCVNPDHLKILTKLQHKDRHRRIATHCKRGHELTPENTYSHGDNRACRLCRAERDRQSRLKNPEQHREKLRRWRLKDPEHVRELDRAGYRRRKENAGIN